VSIYPWMSMSWWWHFSWYVSVHQWNYTILKDSQQAEILNQQFQSVYTKEDTMTLPDKGNSTIKGMNDIYNSLKTCGDISAGSCLLLFI
jgi:hypothetical protein